MSRFGERHRDSQELQGTKGYYQLPPPLFAKVTQWLEDTNNLYKDFRRLAAEPSEYAFMVFQVTNRQTHGNILGDAPQSQEVRGIIKNDQSLPNRGAVVQKITDEEPRFIDILDPSYEALQYPLLFPHAEPGWHPGFLSQSGEEISFFEYIRYSTLHHPRHLKFGKLSEERLIELYSRCQDNTLEWVRNNQKYLRVAEVREVRSMADDRGDGEDKLLPGHVYLPASITGSPRDMAKKALDALGIVARVGRPHFFCTVTCNPKWPEILELGDNPVSYVRVFHRKLRAILKDFREGKHLPARAQFLIHSIEFQKRGLPHAHIAIRCCKDIQDEDYKNYIFAQLPGLNQPELRELVLRHMIHGPCEGTRFQCRADNPRFCSKNFPQPKTEEAFFDQRGNYMPERPCLTEAVIRTPNNKKVVVFLRFLFKADVEKREVQRVDDRDVVEYSKSLLEQYQCHINLKAVSSEGVIKYLFKYIFKGTDKVLHQLTDKTPVSAQPDQAPRQAVVRFYAIFSGFIALTEVCKI